MRFPGLGLIYIMIIAVGCAILAPVLNADDEVSAACQIIYIPGWKSKGTSKKQELFLLRIMFPKGKITVREWESEGNFLKCMQTADELVAKKLADDIGKRPAAMWEKIILVGHSLGGRIAIRTMSRLARKKKPIRRGIFLAAAIPNDDPDIDFAIRNSFLPNINVYCRQDSTLRQAYAYADDLKHALGAYGYAFPFYHRYLLQRRFSAQKNKYENHEAIYYLENLLKQKEILSEIPGKSRTPDRSTERKAIENIQVIQDKPNPPVRIDGSFSGGWKAMETFADWRLEHKRIMFRDRYRIIDPYDYQRANGSEQKMKESFMHIKRQLREQQNNLNTR